MNTTLGEITQPHIITKSAKKSVRIIIVLWDKTKS